MTGCLYGEYNDIEDSAPIGVYSVESYPRASGFGRVLRGYRAEGPPRSRFVASAGTASPHAVFDFWNAAQGGGSESVLFDGCDGNCDEGSGSDYAFIGDWQGSEDCILIGALVQSDRSQDGRLRVQCESPTDDTVLIPTGRSGESLGAAIAPLGALGAALVGAPDAGGGRGALYLLPTNGTALEEFALPALDLAANAGLGSELATFEVEDAGFGDATIVLAAAPGMERVVVLLAGVDSTGARRSEAVACIDGVDVRSPSALNEEGGGLALVDTDGDGRPEALIGDPRADRVLHVPLNALRDAAGCADPAAEVHPGTTEFTCADMPSGNGVVCDGLGSSVTAGDFDADGDQDIALGAALSSVEAAAGAGAVYILPNSGGIDASAGRALSVSSAGPGAELGTRVIVSQTQLVSGGRDELIASAPGVNKLYAFFCSGLPGDTSDGARCLGTPL